MNNERAQTGGTNWKSTIKLSNIELKERKLVIYRKEIKSVRGDKTEQM